MFHRAPMGFFGESFVHDTISLGVQRPRVWGSSGVEYLTATDVLLIANLLETHGQWAKPPAHRTASALYILRLVRLARGHHTPGMCGGARGWPWAREWLSGWLGDPTLYNPEDHRITLVILRCALHDRNCVNRFHGATLTPEKTGPSAPQ